MGGRFSIDKLGYNERNVYFDVMQFDDLELGNFKAYQNDLLYQSARYYLRYQQFIADQHKQEYELHVYFPSMFSGGFNMFIYKLSCLHALNSINIDQSDVELLSGLHILEHGKHSIVLQPGEACVDLFNNVIFDGVNHLISNGTEQPILVECYQPTKQLLYYFAYGDQLTITIPGKYYIFNYKYNYVNGDTVIYSTHFTEPVVQMRLLKGAN